MRTIIEVPQDRLEALEAICKRDAISRAEAIRRAIDALIAKESPARAKQAYGLWRGRDLDGLRYQESLRAEWDS